MSKIVLFYADDIAMSNAEILAQGGHIRHIFPPHAFVAVVPESLDISRLRTVSNKRPHSIDWRSEMMADAWLRMNASPLKLVKEDVSLRQKFASSKDFKALPSEKAQENKLLSKESNPADSAFAMNKIAAQDPEKMAKKTEKEHHVKGKSIEKAGMKGDNNKLQSKDALPHGPAKFLPKPNDGGISSWSGEGHLHPRHAGNDQALQELAELISNPPSNNYIQGPIAIGLVVVSSTLSDYNINASQNQTIIQETLQGTDFLASQNPNANVSFIYDLQNPTVSVPPGSLTLWNTSLPGSGYHVTSVLISGSTTYAGTNGFVYSLDSNGNILATNGLSGMGYNEIRLAMAPGLLIVGTNGYVLGLDPTTLSTLWSTSLPGSGYAVTSVIVSGSTIYAGTNGYVYSLNTSGSVLASNGLSGMGYNEIRLAMGSGILLVGTNGYALGLDPGTLNTSWQTSLPGCGYNITSVLVNGNSLYAGSNGYVYLLDSNGNVTATNGLSGMGNHEVRLDYGFGNLIVGTNGFALSLNPATLSTNWETSLPGCGYYVTSVQVAGGYIFAGCNGYVYELYSNGAVSYTNSLPGTGYHEVRLAASGNTVSAGTYGYALGIYYGNPYSAFEDPWRNAAMQALGYQPNQQGVVDYVNTLIQSHAGMVFGYAAFFTQYPLQHFGYQYGVQLVMTYDNDGWGSGKINQVFAHESCHVFGAADEYSASNCTCGQKYGYYQVPNNNCVNCPGPHYDCLMDQNVLTLCQWSRGQVGWTYFIPGAQTSLPGCGYNITSVLVSGNMFYSGCNGYVYAQDINGNITATNGLSGYGNHEIRLAMAPGLLVIGINGYVLGLDPTTLNINWSTSLPGSGYAVTTVLVSGSTIYAGTNGYVYSLDTSGNVLNQNGLSGMGYNEVRLAMASGQLIVGTNGYALGLDANSLSTNWQTSLPGCGYHVTSVLVSGSNIYAGCNGYVYLLNTSGSVQATNGLGGLGYNEVRLAIGSSGSLIVGTDGYALALDPASLSTIWQTSLPGCGYNITSVLVIGTYVFAGCNGYFYALTMTGGAVAYTNSLSGTGNNEVRLDGNSSLIALGTNGYTDIFTTSTGIA